jgi:hypothetical protein
MEKSEKQQKAPCTATTAPLTKGNFKNKAKKKRRRRKEKKQEPESSGYRSCLQNHCRQADKV